MCLSLLLIRITFIYLIITLLGKKEKKKREVESKNLFNILKSEEYFYQLVLYQLGQFGKLVLSTPLSIKSCISLFIPDATQKELDIMILSILSHKELLQSYYNIGVELSSDNKDVHLLCLPLLLTNYTPSFDKLPIFLHNLATQVKQINNLHTSNIHTFIH